MRPTPRTATDWRAYLQSFSDDVLDGLEDPEQLLHVTDGQRAFLSVSADWSWLSSAAGRLRPVADVAPLVDVDLNLVGLYERSDDDVDPWPPPQVLRRCLVVSADEDAAHLLLDPGEVDGHGEWTAWWYASWHPGFDVLGPLLTPERAQEALAAAGS